MNTWMNQFGIPMRMTKKNSLLFICRLNFFCITLKRAILLHTYIKHDNNKKNRIPDFMVKSSNPSETPGSTADT
jgi:hypothetical protein